MTRTIISFVVAFSLPLACAAADSRNSSFTNYAEQIPGTSVKFEMVAIPGGTLMKGDGKISIAPFYMEKFEAQWEEYVLWVFGQKEEMEKEKLDGISRP